MKLDYCLQNSILNKLVSFSFLFSAIVCSQETAINKIHKLSLLKVASLKQLSQYILILAEDEESPDLKDMQKKKKQVFEAPRPQNYYHIEYYLIPEDSELMKTDIVTYGVAAKLYMERHDARVIKTWQDGELTWIAWAHRQGREITVT